MKTRMKAALTSLIVALTWLVAGRTAGDPWRSRVLFLVCLLLAFVAGLLYEATRKHGTLELLEKLAAQRDQR